MREQLRDSAKVVGWGLVLYGGVVFVGAFLAQNRTGTLAAQAVVTEWGVGRLAVAWSDPHGPTPTTRTVARRAGLGAALGLGAAALVILFGLATGAAARASGSPVIADLVVGLLAAGLVAMRDELLLRGLVIRAFRKTAPPLIVLLVCGCAAGAARYGVATSGSVPNPDAAREALVASIGAVAFAALWLRDGGAWLAWGAHTAWQWASGPVIRGGLVDLRWAQGRWGGGDAGLEGSLATAAALTLVATGAIYVWRRSQVPEAAKAE